MDTLEALKEFDEWLEQNQDASEEDIEDVKRLREAVENDLNEPLVP